MGHSGETPESAPSLHPDAVAHNYTSPGRGVVPGVSGTETGTVVDATEGFRKMLCMTEVCLAFRKEGDRLLSERRSKRRLT